jgi:hypothetical protein
MSESEACAGESEDFHLDLEESAHSTKEDEATVRCVRASFGILILAHISGPRALSFVLILTWVMHTMCVQHCDLSEWLQIQQWFRTSKLNENSQNFRLNIFRKRNLQRRPLR